MKRKKIGLILCGVLLCFNFVFAHNKVSKNWSGTNSGDYVIYRDYSWKNETWIGFLYYDKNTVGSFLFTDKGKTFVQIDFFGELIDGEFEIMGQNNISGQQNDQNYIYAVNYLMQILPKLYKWKEKPGSESLVVKKSTKRIFEVGYGGECVINFSSYIPLFYIDSILDKNQKTILKIEEMGVIKKPELFFDFAPIQLPKNKQSSVILDMNADRKIHTINNIKLNLDSQWEQDTENSFFLNSSAFLTVTPIAFRPDPAISNNETAFIVKYLCSSGKDAKVLLDKTDIIGSKEKFKIISMVYDIRTDTIKTSIKLIIKRGDLKYDIVSLTVDNHVYEANKSYFNTLF